MSVFSGHVDAVVTALNWRRTLVIEQGRWQFRRTNWKPHGDGVRNIRTVHEVEPNLVSDKYPSERGSHEVMEKHTQFEYEVFEWHKYRSFSAQGDDSADVRWPECARGPDQRISERRETYRAKFSVGAEDGEGEYAAELD